MLTATGLKRSDLGAHGHKVVLCGGKQVLVIAQENRLFAIANRCPHEGYPLSEGTLGPGCVLTCNWHNWKFDLDVSDPPAEELRSRALSGIAAAIADNDRPRMAREVARLQHAGFDAREALVHGFRLCEQGGEAFGRRLGTRSQRQPIGRRGIGVRHAVFEAPVT